VARPGFEFVAWSPALEAVVTKDITYTATWRAVLIVVPINPPDPTVIDPSDPVDPYPIIINNPAPATSAPRYITVSPSPTQPSTGSGSSALSRDADAGGAAQAGGGNTTIADDEAPLASGAAANEVAEGISPWLVVSLVLFALVVLIGALLLARRAYERQH
jgi:hypothetical protein